MCRFCHRVQPNCHELKTSSAALRFEGHVSRMYGSQDPPNEL